MTEQLLSLMDELRAANRNVDEARFNAAADQAQEMMQCRVDDDLAARVSRVDACKGRADARTFVISQQIRRVVRQTKEH